MSLAVDAQRLHRRIVNAWCMYDWANSAFSTTVMAALLPPYFSNVAAASLGKAQASSIWGYSTSIAMALGAIAGPIMGAMADHTGQKKGFMRVFWLLAVIFTGCLFFVREGDWLPAVAFFIVASVAAEAANVFYDSLLPHVAGPDEMDRVSARGFALGYLGGGLLLLVNLLWYMKPEWFGFRDGSVAIRASFLSVAVWWAVFALPLFRHVPEPPLAAGGQRQASPAEAVRAAFQRLGRTFREIRRYKELFKYLVAFWLYADGIGTIMKMATIYGAEIGIGTADLAGALLLTQVVGVPFTFLFGALPDRIGTKRSIYISLAVYAFISVVAYWMTEPWQFWVLAGLVGTVQGGSQALSRSLFGAMCPKSRSAEFFGFYDVSSKFAGIAGPLLFGVTAAVAGTSRWAIFSLIIFFVLGAWLLSRVDERQGMAVALAENAAGGGEA